MQSVTLKPLLHRNQECIGIYFFNSTILNNAIQKQAGARWSKTQKCWYIPQQKQNYDKLVKALEGKAVIDYSALSQYLKAKKAGNFQSAASLLPVKKAVPDSAVQQKKAAASNEGKQHIIVYKGSRISAVNAHVIPNMQAHLKLKAYSVSTMRTYLGEMKQLLGLLKDIPADDLETVHLKRYLLFCHEKLHLTENSLHSRMNAMKYYYEQVLGKEKFFWEIPRPKKQLQLPHFFNQDEITAILNSVDNVKHKTMLMLAYSSGLRVSEVVSIRTKNIDSSRMCILIKQAKGKKDRIVKLSPVLLIMLREYWGKYKPARDGVLFEGQYAGEPYSTRSLQMVLAAAKQKAGVLKPGSIHALRHSFATHLLDKGTDVTMIMKLLGHNDIKTTLRYLHVTNRDMLQIISPLDDLKLD
ncbi:MAG: tyrosine-type recombinase/integrase [Chitinophagaceae bacterium]|nr:tyrosine-type recombinase/integrase [Chitinophagaceae bacterium]